MTKVDVNQVIDSASVRGLPLLVIIIATVVLTLDGLDIQIISLAAPLLSRDFHVAPPALGPVLAAALVGMALGGFALGAMGDAWGRRPTLALSVALFAAATLLSAGASDVSILTVWRFVTGIGLGGAIPNVMALLAEFTPPRWRTHAIAAAVIGVPVGGTGGAVIAAQILPHMGWRPLFVVGGLLPAVALLAIWLRLPESPRFLATRPQRREALAALLNRLVGAGRYSAADEFELSERVLEKRQTRLAVLLAGPVRRETLALWLIFLTNMFMIFTFFSWTPVILHSLSLSLEVAVRGSLIFNLAGVCGGVAAAWLVFRFGSRWPGLLLSVIGIVALSLISGLLSVASHTGAPLDVAVLMSEIAAAGFAMIGIQTIAYRLSTHLYPTTIRSSGVGWAAGAGRVGGILSSLIAGWLYVRFQGPGLFAILACVVAATLVCLLGLRRHMVAAQ